MRKIVLVVSVVVLLGGGARADVPVLLNFTGTLQTGAGPYEGPATVTLALYPDQTMQTPVWSDTQEVYVQAGRFYVLLGANPKNPLPSGVFDGQDLFLGVRVDDNPEMVPRLQVTSVPYAFRSGDAGLLGGLPPGAFAKTGHTHEFADLVGVVPEESLPGSVVLSAELTGILGGYVTVATLNAALANKADVGHGHAVGDVEGLQAAAEGWARGVCFDTAAEIASALPGWDQNASDDLTTATNFSGDVSGGYGALTLGNGVVRNQHINDTTLYVSVRDSSNNPRFVVTDGTPILRFTGGSGSIIGFNESNNEVILSADTNYLQRRVAGTCSSGNYISQVAADGSVVCQEDKDTLGNLTCSGLPVRKHDTGWGCVDRLPIEHGGTNSTATPTAGAVAYGTGSAYAFTPAPTEVGRLLRGVPGSAPIWDVLQASDLPSGSGNYIQNQVAAAQNASFRIAGSGHVGEELWVGPTGRIRLHNMDWTGWPVTMSDYGFVEYVPMGDGSRRMRVGTGSDTGTVPSSGGPNLELTSVSSVLVTTGWSYNTATAAVFYPPLSDEMGRATVSVGHGFHWIPDTIRGATVGGGGNEDAPNEVLAHYSTIGGGAGNRIQHKTGSQDYYATIGGGLNNQVSDPYAVIGGGVRNIASGYSSTVAGGSSNIASGSYSTVAGGYANTASAPSTFAAGRRAKASSEGCFVWADSNNVDFTCAFNNGFYARATGGFYLFTNTTVDPKCTLTDADSTWSCSSDRNAKADLVPVDPLDVLDRLMEVPVYTFRMKEAPPDIRHMGPMAQDFHRAFHLGDSDKMIGQGDVGGVALAAIQGLRLENQGLHLENQALRDENAVLRARLESLESRLLRLERRLSR